MFRLLKGGGLFLDISNVVTKHTEKNINADAYEITAPLEDLSYDGSHYGHPVGHAVAMKVLEVMMKTWA